MNMSCPKPEMKKITESIATGSKKLAQTTKSELLPPTRTKPEKPKSMAQTDDVISQREEFENDNSPPQLRMGLTQHKIH